MTVKTPWRLGSLLAAVLLLGGLVLAGPAAAASTQPGDGPDELNLKQYEGVYVLPSGARFVVEVKRGKVMVRPASQMEATSMSATPAGLRRFDARAEAVIEGLARGETTPLRMALAPTLRDLGTADLATLFETFTQTHGALRDFAVLGTMPRNPGQASTLVHLAFNHGAEVVRLDWHDGELVTMQRGAYTGETHVRPVASVPFRQVGRYGPNDSAITFNLRNDGQVESMTLAGRYGAVTAYRLAVWPDPDLAVVVGQ